MGSLQSEQCGQEILMAGLQENVQFIPLGAGVQSDGHPLAAQPPLMSEQQNMTVVS